MGIRIRIEPDPRLIRELDQRIGRFGDQSLFNRIFSSAADRAVKAAETAARRGITDTYTIKAGDVRPTMTTRRFRDGARLDISDSARPLSHFKVKQPKAGPMTATVRKDGGGTIARAFRGQGSLPSTRIFQRTGTSRLPIEQLHGPGAANMVKDGDIIERVEERATEVMNNRLEHEMGRLLK